MGNFNYDSLSNNIFPHFSAKTINNTLPYTGCSTKYKGENKMPTVNLSADFCRKAICPEGKNKIDYRDKTIKGFILECRSTGGKTYALRYRDKHNRQCQYKIGNYGDLTFEKARKAAEQARSQVVLGKDPAGDKRVKRRVPTLSYFVQFHYMPLIKQYKRSWKADESMLKTHILPKVRHPTPGQNHHHRQFQTSIMAWCPKAWPRGPRTEDWFC